MFFIESSNVYINLKYIISVDSTYKDVKMINEDDYDLTDEELDGLVELLETK